MIVTDCDTKPYYQRSKPRKCYIYSKANWNTIKEEISITSTKIRHMQDRGTNVQEMSDTFKKELFQSMDKHIPSKEIRSKNNLPWINHKIRKLFKKKQRLYQQAKKTKKWTNYRQFQKEVKRQVRKAEYSYINDTIIKGLETNNTKPFWNIEMEKTIATLTHCLDIRRLLLFVTATKQGMDQLTLSCNGCENGCKLRNQWGRIEADVDDILPIAMERIKADYPNDTSNNYCTRIEGYSLMQLQDEHLKDSVTNDFIEWMKTVLQNATI
ncbi:unnamed protein product [Mytilus edulis]|uniref:Uncharacterized protein n=1 Tax=Mytilus edulis TaxID=6550 RepID=A0A8S3QB43_MYTED|nr:unnamed protein product [Mytilus edulis]